MDLVLLEGRVVGEAAATATGRPGVVGRLVLGAGAPTAAALAATAGVAAATATTEAATTLALGLVDLRRGVLQRRADLVDLDLVDGALLALTGLVRPLLE